MLDQKIGSGLPMPPSSAAIIATRPDILSRALSLALGAGVKLGKRLPLLLSINPIIKFFEVLLKKLLSIVSIELYPMRQSNRRACQSGLGTWTLWPDDLQRIVLLS